MPQGTVKKIVSDRGFGFISANGGDVFFHHSVVVDNKFDELKEGQAVTYEIATGPDARTRQGPAGDLGSTGLMPTLVSRIAAFSRTRGTLPPGGGPGVF